MAPFCTARNAFQSSQETASAISAGNAEAHSFQNTGQGDLVIWAFGNRFPHEVCIYPSHGVAFVEGLGAEVPLDQAVRTNGQRSAAGVNYRPQPEWTS